MFIFFLSFRNTKLNKSSENVALSDMYLPQNKGQNINNKVNERERRKVIKCLL